MSLMLEKNIKYLSTKYNLCVHQSSAPGISTQMCVFYTSLILIKILDFTNDK